MAEVGDRWLCTCGDDDRLRVWDSKNGWALHNQIVGRPDAFLCLLSLQSVFGDPVLASAGANDKLQLWDVSAEWPMIVSVSQTDETRIDDTAHGCVCVQWETPWAGWTGWDVCAWGCSVPCLVVPTSWLGWLLFSGSCGSRGHFLLLSSVPVSAL